MAVISYREVIPRTASHKFGESPTAERKYIVTVDEPTPTQTLVNAVGIFHAAAHPEFSYLKCLNIQVTETDRHHAEITYSYELPKQEELDPNPLARPDVWSFSIGGAQVPALVYYDGSGNGSRLPLVNAAGDFFEGLTTLEAEVRASISGNRPTFPLANASAVTNSVNASPYLGGASHTWLCAGISGQQATEVVNDTELRYWQITVELVYRASGHDLLLPHVGWHYVTGNGGAKFRTFVRSKDGTDEEASAPQPLNSDGSQKYVGGTSGPPDILTRRVYPEADFSNYFGTPPF
jgi:hypothetical protein